MEWFIVWGLGFGVVSALAAAARERNPVAWFFWGALFGVFGLIAVLVMGRGAPPAPAWPSDRQPPESVDDERWRR